MYAFMGKADGKAWTVMRVDDNGKAESVLHLNGIKTLDSTAHFNDQV